MKFQNIIFNGNFIKFHWFNLNYQNIIHTSEIFNKNIFTLLIYQFYTENNQKRQRNYKTT